MCCQLTHDLDIPIFALEVVNRAHVVQAAAGHQVPWRSVGTSHHPGGLERDGVDLRTHGRREKNKYYIDGNITSTQCTCMFPCTSLMSCSKLSCRHKGYCSAHTDFGYDFSHGPCFGKTKCMLLWKVTGIAVFAVGVSSNQILLAKTIVSTLSLTLAFVFSIKKCLLFHVEVVVVVLH